MDKNASHEKIIEESMMSAKKHVLVLKKFQIS